MWKNIVLVITLVLAAAAVWLLYGMSKPDVREQFIGCKVENVQLTIQYGRCLADLEAASAQSSTALDPDPGGMVGDPDPGGMVGDPDPGTVVDDPDPGGMVLDPDPGGMITDPDPGGMVGDYDPGGIIYKPTWQNLKECKDRNEEFRAALKACADLRAGGTPPAAD